MKWTMVDNLIHKNWNKKLFVLNFETIGPCLKIKNIFWKCFDMMISYIAFTPWLYEKIYIYNDETLCEIEKYLWKKKRP